MNEVQKVVKQGILIFPIFHEIVERIADFIHERAQRLVDRDERIQDFRFARVLDHHLCCQLFCVRAQRVEPLVVHEPNPKVEIVDRRNVSPHFCVKLVKVVVLICDKLFFIL